MSRIKTTLKHLLHQNDIGQFVFIGIFGVFLFVPSLSLAEGPKETNDSLSSEQEPSNSSHVFDWGVHFQTTEITQAYPSFHGINGPQSLNSHAQNKETMSATVFSGGRMPWSTSETTTEIYVDPELNQGYGLSHVLGVAGFPNGEAQKAGEPYPILNWARYFVRQTFGFGGAQENIISDENQLQGVRDVARLTMTIGKISIPDIFDNNNYSHDPRTQFMNWSLIDAGAYDYVADQKGYTDGIVFDLNQREWALRYGYFFAPKTPNSRFLNESISGEGGHNIELEERYKVFEQPGDLRLLGFANMANAGSYKEILENPALDLDIAATRRERVKYGFVVNEEQSFTDDLGFFSRVSWNDGQEEISSYTDIDESLSGGISLKGTHWGFSEDTVGLAGVVNGLSQAHRAFLKAGGEGILIGDGFLNYASEHIVETYYNWMIFKPVATTFDYQFIDNPGYNQSRGPVHVFAIRAHVEF